MIYLPVDSKTQHRHSPAVAIPILLVNLFCFQLERFSVISDPNEGGKYRRTSRGDTIGLQFAFSYNLMYKINQPPGMLSWHPGCTEFCTKFIY